MNRVREVLAQLGSHAQCGDSREALPAADGWIAHFHEDEDAVAVRSLSRFAAASAELWHLRIGTLYLRIGDRVRAGQHCEAGLRLAGEHRWALELTETLQMLQADLRSLRGKANRVLSSLPDRASALAS